MGKVILLLFNIICCIATAKSCVPLWGQCGGLHHTGSTECCSGSTCVFQNDYYSQCLDAPGGPSQPATNPPDSGDRQNGVTTRYWDCCKASCSWRQKASVSSPVQTCAQDGVNSVDFDARSVCDGGNAHMCHNQQPWNVSENLSYGYAAAYLSGKQERDWCCACYSLIFTSGPVAGKEMIVQVTNTGGDLGENHFDLQIPGGGFGIFDGCTAQFPEVASSSWGERYGGISRRSDCKKLPVPLRKGCFWRFDWFQNADNPKMTLKEVPCPDALTAKTGCIRQ